jgi:hypothetical protein
LVLSTPPRENVVEIEQSPMTLVELGEPTAGTRSDGCQRTHSRPASRDCIVVVKEVMAKEMTVISGCNTLGQRRGHGGINSGRTVRGASANRTERSAALTPV